MRKIDYDAGSAYVFVMTTNMRASFGSCHFSSLHLQPTTEVKIVFRIGMLQLLLTAMPANSKIAHSTLDSFSLSSFGDYSSVFCFAKLRSK